MLLSVMRMYAVKKYISVLKLTEFTCLLGLRVVKAKLISRFHHVQDLIAHGTLLLLSTKLAEIPHAAKLTLR